MVGVRADICSGDPSHSGLLSWNYGSAAADRYFEEWAHLVVQASRSAGCVRRMCESSVPSRRWQWWGDRVGWGWWWVRPVGVRWRQASIASAARPAGRLSVNSPGGWLHREPPKQLSCPCFCDFAVTGRVVAFV